MKKNLVFLFALMILGSSCEKSEEITPAETNKSSSKVSIVKIAGLWQHKNTKAGFPSDAPFKAAETNEKYEFDTTNLRYKVYQNDKLVEEGTYQISTYENNLARLTFSTDGSTATTFFENDQLVIGNRIPKGSMLIDYDDFRYFVKSK